jgi:chorismate mutase
MENINQLRKRIDEVDEQILHALSKRIELCRSIGLLKKKQRIPIKDTPRENDVHTHIKKKAAALGLDLVQVEEIYRQIVNMCTAIQELEEKGG